MGPVLLGGRQCHARKIYKCPQRTVREQSVDSSAAEGQLRTHGWQERPMLDNDLADEFLFSEALVCQRVESRFLKRQQAVMKLMVFGPDLPEELLVWKRVSDRMAPHDRTHTHQPRNVMGWSVLCLKNVR